MAALTADSYPGFRSGMDMIELPVGASVTIYRGSFVGLDPAGYAKAFEPGDQFAGVAEKQIDNSSGAAGAKFVRCRVQGDLDFALSSAAYYHVGRYVFATDDNTLGLLGHPDALVGKIIQRGDAAGKVTVRLRNPFDNPEIPSFGFGPAVLALNPAAAHDPTGATAGTLETGEGLIFGSALGLGVLDIGTGGVKGQFDAVAEVASATVYTNGVFKVANGITFETELYLSDIGDDAALDVDWGLGTALTANSIANIDHADMANLAAFHMDGNAASIFAQSDDTTTDVAVVDTTIDNALAAAKKFKVVVRPAGGVQFWIDSGSGYSRVLSGTTFAVAAAAQLAAFVNMEKTSNDTTAQFNLLQFVAKGCWA